MGYLSQNVIINEFLNNWFNYKELSEYLHTDIFEIERALDINNLAAANLSEKEISKIELHKKYVNTPLDVNDINRSIDNYEGILLIANQFINSGLSIRKAALELGISKSYLYDVLNEELPKVSLYVYKQVFDLLKANKSYGVDNKEVIEQVMNCYNLLKMGLTEKEISERLNISEKIVQRNLSYRLCSIDKNKYLEASEILRNSALSSLVSGNKENLERERDSHGRFTN